MDDLEHPGPREHRDAEGLLPAVRALYAGKADLAQQLLPDDSFLVPYEAALLRRNDRLRALLAADSALANELSADGFTPLHGACFASDAEAARLLVEHGADLDALAQHESIRVRPLGTAAFADATECARVLLEAGADPDAAAAGGFTPLHAAASNGNADLVRLLVDHGANPAVPLPDGRTPAELARAEGHDEVADALATPA